MAPVLVQGESGTGKELVARAIHDVSARAGQPFVRGQLRRDSREAARGRVLRRAQGRVHRRERRPRRLLPGGQRRHAVPRRDRRPAVRDAVQAAARDPGARGARDRRARPSRPINVRIVSATHKDLAAEVQAGRFRQDLFYRLNVIDIKVPPLRERLGRPAGDRRRAARAPRARGRRVAARRGWRADARALLARYAFPGNVRELENLLHRAVALSDGEAITGADLALPEALLADAQPRARDPEAQRRSPRWSSTIADGPTVAEAMGAGAAARARGAGRARAGARRPRALPRRGRARRSSCARSSARASTAPPPAPASGCRCARCATGWRGSASPSPRRPTRA